MTEDRPVLKIDPTRPGEAYVLVLGDSITALAGGNLHVLRPTWLIDGLGGRLVTTLPDLLAQYATSQRRNPTILVVALGTNSSTAWVGHDYLAALPYAQRVVFVTPYRDPAVTDQDVVLDRLTEYAATMHSIANANAGVTVADWRALMGARHAELLVDGGHPHEAGQQAWADLVLAAAVAAGEELV